MLPVLTLFGLAHAYRQHDLSLDAKRNDTYERSVIAFDEGDFPAAIAGFSALGGYRDADSRLAEVLAEAEPLQDQIQSAQEAYLDRDYETSLRILDQVLAAAPEYGDAVELQTSVRESYASELMLNASLGETSRDWSAVEQSLRIALSLQPHNDSLAAEVDFVLSNHAPVVYTRDGVVLTAGPAGEDERALTADVGATFPSWSPDRSQIAFVKPTPKGSRFDGTIMVMNADGSDLRAVVDRVLPFSIPQWSPDGSAVAYPSVKYFDEGTFTGRISVNLLEISSGQEADITGEAHNYANSPTWSPKGDRLAFVGQKMERRRGGGVSLLDGDIWTVDVRTGEMNNLTRGELEDENWIQWSPSGDQMLVLTNPGEWSDPKMMHLSLIGVDSGLDLVEVASDWQIGLPSWSPDGSRFAYVLGGTTVRIWADGVEEWVGIRGKLSTSVSWSPDGSRLFLPTSSPPNPSWLLSVDENFGELVPVRIDADGLSGGNGMVMWAPMSPAGLPGVDPS